MLLPCDLGPLPATISIRISGLLLLRHNLILDRVVGRFFGGQGSAFAALMS